MRQINPEKNMGDFEKKYREKQARIADERQILFQKIAEEAVNDLKYVGNSRSWKIDDGLTNSIVIERVLQELCNAIIEAHDRFNKKDDSIGYPPSLAKKLVEQAYEVNLQKVDDGYSFTLKVKTAFSFSNS